MISMLARARRLLNVDNLPEPASTDADQFRELLARLAEPIDYTDVTHVFKSAAKEVAMTIRPEDSYATSFIGDLQSHRTRLEEAKKALQKEQGEANTEHDAQLKRLADEVASRNALHNDATVDFEDRIADLDRTIASVEAGLKVLVPAAPEPPKPAESGK